MKKKVLIIAAVVLVILIIGANILSRVARDEFKKHSDNIAGLSLEIGTIDVSFLTVGLKLKNVKIYPTGKTDEQNLLASTELLSVTPSIMELLHKTIHIKNVTLDKPYINYTVYKNKQANWDALTLSKGESAPKEEPQAPKEKSAWKVVVDSVSISGGEVKYADNYLGRKLDLTNVDIDIDNITSSSTEKLPTSLSLKANFGKTGGGIYVNGKANVFAEKLNMTINGKLKSTPISYFSSFYAGSVPFSIEGGVINISSNAAITDNYLASSNGINISGLKTGGNMQGQLVEQLLAKTGRDIQLNLSVNGNVKGQLNFSSDLSKQITKYLLDRAAKEISPLNIIKNPIKGVEKLKGFFGR